MKTDIPPKDSNPLDSVFATRKTIDTLFSHKLISSEARERGIQLLYPLQNWSLWTSRFLSILGISLILSGIIYFFAFNWIKLPPIIKFGLIQTGILGCVIASFFYKSKLLWKQFSLLSAGVLVGVFLAIFGQIYQTGADSYNLFVMWTLLILPWVMISKFTIFWALWLIISNIALSLFWTQAVLPKPEADMLIFSYLILFNVSFLIFREVLCKKGIYWLQNYWTRIVLISSILLLALFPTVTFIAAPSIATYSIILGTLCAIIIHLAFYFIYRYKIPDISAISATLLSTCIILEFAIYEILTELLKPSYSIIYLLIGFITPVVFTLAIIILQTIAKKMKKAHA